MKNKFVLPLVITILLILLACSIGYEGAVLTNDEELNKASTATALIESVQGFTKPDPADTGVLINRVTVEPVPPLAAAEPQPTTPPAAPELTEPESNVESATEYSVTAQNFDCICAETGTVTQEFKVEGDKLVLGGQTFDKIGDNTFKRSWMGYYILVSGEGDNKTETQVEEERSSVIILTDDGYIMENYQGDNGSPCCINTFKKNK
ncbi:MAG: hypothetical protein WBI14_03115 [Anaerolineaceae bacterium]